MRFGDALRSAGARVNHARAHEHHARRLQFQLRFDVVQMKRRAEGQAIGFEILPPTAFEHFKRAGHIVAESGARIDAAR